MRTGTGTRFNIRLNQLEAVSHFNFALWFGRDRIERERNAAITRRAAGREIKAPDKYDPSEGEAKKRERSSLAADLKAVQVF
jgi:hypothetical protein